MLVVGETCSFAEAGAAAIAAALRRVPQIRQLSFAARVVRPNWEYVRGKVRSNPSSVACLIHTLRRCTALSTVEVAVGDSRADPRRRCGDRQRPGRRRGGWDRRRVGQDAGAASLGEVELRRMGALVRGSGLTAFSLLQRYPPSLSPSLSSGARAGEARSGSKSRQTNVRRSDAAFLPPVRG